MPIQVRAVLIAAFVAGTAAAAAQTPTDVAIRIQNLRWSAARPRDNVMTRVRVTGSIIRTTAAATAASAADARRLAQRAALAGAARKALAGSRTARTDADAFAASVAGRKDVQARIVKQTKTAKGYHVEAEVAISAARLSDLLRSTSCSNYRAVVVLPERVDGREQGIRKVETAIVAALAERKMRVYDWDFASRQSQSAALVRSALGGDRAAALQVGARFVANLVVLGRVEARFSQDNEGIISYLATANVRVVQADTGQVVWADEMTEKGFGRDRAQAARTALDALARSAAGVVPDGFLDRLREYRFTVSTSGPGVDTDRLKSFLESQPGFVSVEEGSGPGVNLVVRSTDRPGAMAGALAGSGRYEVLAVDRAP